MGDTSGGLGSESFASPECAMPLRQFGAPAQSSLEESSLQEQTMGLPQHRPRKMKSLVWTHFVKLVINGEQKAKCLHCHRLFSGNSKNGTSHLKDHMTRRCPRRFIQVVSRQKLLTFNHRQDSTMRVENLGNDPADLELSPVCLDGESEHILSGNIASESGFIKNSIPNRTREITEEPKVVIECQSDGHEQTPVCVDGASQCSEQECGSLSNLVVKATYKEDTVRFDFPPTSSVNELEKEVATNLKLALRNFKMKYQDEDKEWMLMTMDSHLSYVINLTKSSESNVIRLLVSDL